MKSGERLAFFVDFARSVISSDAVDAASRRMAAAAPPEILDGRLILGPSRNGPHHEELSKRHRPLEDVPAGETELLLHARRTHHFRRHEHIADIAVL